MPIILEVLLYPVNRVNGEEDYGHI